MWLCPCALMLVITPSLWRVITLSMWRVITLSLWWQARLEAYTLYDTGKSLRVWVRLLSIGPKDHMQKGYYVTRHSLLPLGGRGKSLSMCVRLGRAKRPYAKEVLHGALSLVANGGIGKSLKARVRLGKADRPHAKKATYHANVFRFWPVCGGMMSW